MKNKALLIDFNLLYVQGARNAMPINLQQNVHYRAAGRAAQACVVAQKVSFFSELFESCLRTKLGFVSSCETGKERNQETNNGSFSVTKLV